jgi:flagellar hook-associated protein 3 FlgL
MRITQRSVALTSLQGLNRNLSAVGKLQQQLTSGKAISQPSDSPTGTNTAMQTRSALTAAAQYDRNISDGQNWLKTTDSTLGSMITQVQRVRDLTVQAMNTGSMSGIDQKAIAAEVDQLHASLLGLANTQVQGRAIFGGTTAATTAYAADGTYTGRGGTVAEPAVGNMRRIADSAAVRVDITGAEAFGDQGAGDDLFAVVAKISSAATTDPSTLGTQLGALDDALTRMTNALADIGARSKRLDNAQQVNSDHSLALTTQLAGVEDIDLPKTIMNLQMQQNGYQAALSATSKSIQPSLVDFLH